MNRDLTVPCRFTECGHLGIHHVATPELVTGQERDVRWCIPCQRHEVVYRSRLHRLFPKRAE